METLVFDHLPKCGGTSIKSWLMANYPAESTYQIDGRKPHYSVAEFVSLPTTEQEKCKLIVGHEASRIYSQLFFPARMVTVLREPVERMVSHYYYVRSDKWHYLHESVMSRRISLGDYCHTDLSAELSNGMVQHFAGMSLAEVDAEPDVALERAKRCLRSHYAVVGDQSDLAGFASRVQKMSSLPVPFNGERENVTPDRPLSRELDAEDERLIMLANQLDVILYDWACEELILKP